MDAYEITSPASLPCARVRQEGTIMDILSDPTYNDCAACGEPADYCAGGHGPACENCDGYESAHTSRECVATQPWHASARVLAYPIAADNCAGFYRDDTKPVEVSMYGDAGMQVWDHSRRYGKHATAVYDVYIVTDESDEALEKTLAYATGEDPYPDYRLTVRQDSQVWEVC